MIRDEQDARLEKIMIMLVELSKGNFNVRADLAQDDELFNAVLSGLNMLAEELTHFKLQLDIKSRLLSNTLENVSEVVYAIRMPHLDVNSIRFEFISPRVYQLIGYTDQEIYNNAALWLNSIHNEDIDGLANALKRLAKGEEVTCEYRIKDKKNHSYIWIEDKMCPKLSNDDIQVFCAARDITQRKKLDEEREILIRDLNSRYNELTQFSYIVSHNLRSPVAGIIGACNLLKMPISEAEKEVTQNYVLEAATRLDDLLWDLNMILSTKDTINQKLESFSVTSTLTDILQMLEIPIAESLAVVQLDVAPKADTILSVKGYIQSSLYNLVSNAIKFRRPDVPLKIRIKVWKEHNMVCFEVADNGIGIDLPRHQHELFGLYQRLNLDVEGKGLGLHMTRAQIESLGGRIVVDSKTGKGSRFTIRLPQNNIA